MAIKSIRPEHLQTIWVAEFKDWAVEPARLPAQSPFCGRGYITTDCPRREHTRALLKPSFNKANMTDLSTFGGYVRMALDQIPRDGSTGDLQSLFFNLVRCRCIVDLEKRFLLMMLTVSRYSDLVPIWRVFLFTSLAACLPTLANSLKPLTMRCSGLDSRLHLVRRSCSIETRSGMNRAGQPMHSRIGTWTKHESTLGTSFQQKTIARAMATVINDTSCYMLW